MLRHLSFAFKIADKLWNFRFFRRIFVTIIIHLLSAVSVVISFFVAAHFLVITVVIFVTFSLVITVVVSVTTSVSIVVSVAVALFLMVTISITVPL